MTYLEWGTRVLIAVVFLVSAGTKLVDLGGFARSLAQLRLLAEPWVRPVAVTVVAAETVIPLLLLVPHPVAGLAGLAVAAGLLTGFSGAIALSLRRGVRAPCRCFGRTSTPLGTRHLVRNGLLLVVVLTGATGLLVGTGEARPAGLVVAALTGLVLAVLVTVADDLVDLFAPRRPAPGGEPAYHHRQQ